VRVLEVAGLGPVPFAAMLLSGLGAEVIRVDRPGVDRFAGLNKLGWALDRGRRSIVIDLKSDEGTELVLSLAERSDVLLEGFRPGVVEKLGIGPEVCKERNPALVYVRVTGYGQEGPLASAAGHDLNYLASAGALYNIGRPPAPPSVPLNYLADFGGGGSYAVIGVLSALLERHLSGQGQVVDVSMIDGVSSLATMFHGWVANGLWQSERGTNEIEGAAPYYNVYATADGEFVAVAAMEPQFYREFLTTLDLDPAAWPQEDRELWPRLVTELQGRFTARTRDEWAEVFAGRDACVSAVLHLDEAPDHPHARARHMFRDAHGARLPAPAPRFSRSQTTFGDPPVAAGEHTVEILRALALSDGEISSLLDAGVVHASGSGG
jgi:alpha-methylacyl-CoA racemase